MRDVRERRKKGVDFLNQKETDLLLLLLLKHRTGSLSTFNPLLDLGLHIATSLSCCLLSSRDTVDFITTKANELPAEPISGSAPTSRHSIVYIGMDVCLYTLKLSSCL
jgi:hypothetical protein